MGNPPLVFDPHLKIFPAIRWIYFWCRKYSTWIPSYSQLFPSNSCGNPIFSESLDSREFASPPVVHLPRALPPPVEFTPRIPKESEKSPNPRFSQGRIRTPVIVLSNNSRHRSAKTLGRAVLAVGKNSLGKSWGNSFLNPKATLVPIRGARPHGLLENVLNHWFWVLMCSKDRWLY